MSPHLTNDIQASVNQMSGAGKLVQQALGSMLEILKQEVFNATTVNFLGPRGPLVLPSMGPVPSRPVRPSVRAKNLDHLYTGIYAL